MKRPSKSDPLAGMTPAEYRKSLVMPVRVINPADPTPADSAADAARDSLVAVGQTPDALVSLKGRRSPPPPTAPASRQRAASGQPALAPLAGPSGGGQGHVPQQPPPAAEAAAAASEEVLASPRQQRYEAATKL